MIGLYNPPPVYHAALPNFLRVNVPFTSANWNTIGSHEVFTLTGFVRVHVMYLVTGSLTSAGAAQISFGREGTTAEYAAAQVVTNLSAGRAVAPGGTFVGAANWASNFMRFDSAGLRADFFIPNGNDLGYEITVADLTGGTIEAVCNWAPLSSDGLVVAGAGGSL